MVNESGASIYSASEVAREEFPDYDITVRGPEERHRSRTLYDRHSRHPDTERHHG